MSKFSDVLFSNQNLSKLLIDGTELTPMIRQYIEIKNQYQNDLLFYRMGDFYELFFEDAVNASQCLGITLTRRGKLFDHDIPMCGVPYHSADDYLSKLITNGFTVAICEQTEDPLLSKKRGAKSVVKREVVRLVTAGTITEEHLLDPQQSNFLMSLGYFFSKEKYHLALAWIDISTGAFYVKSTHSDYFLSDVMRIQPKEIIVPECLFQKKYDVYPDLQTLSRILVTHPDHFFDPEHVEKHILSYYGLTTLDGINHFSYAERSAIGSAILYIEKTQIKKRPALMLPSKEPEAGRVFVDAATRTSLELVKTISGEKDGSLFRSINRTLTNAGSRLLMERLVSPLSCALEINQRLDAVSFFIDYASCLSELQENLKKVPDITRAISRLSVDRGSPRDMSMLLTGMRLSQKIAESFKDKILPKELHHCLLSLKEVPVLLYGQLDQALSDTLPHSKRDGDFIRTGYHSKLDEIRLLRDDSRKVIAQLQREYSELTQIKSLKIKFNNLLGYFLEVPSSQIDLLTKNQAYASIFIHRQTMANGARFTTTELVELENKISNAANESLSIEFSIFDEMLEKILTHTDFFHNLSKAFAAIDVSSSLASLALEQNYCRPIVDHSLMFKVEEGRHPVVEQALFEQKAYPFTPNNCDLSPKSDCGNGQIWLLTGPNMGGKSTFLRQNALIAILAQIGSYVSAKTAHIGIVDRLFSRVGASDDLARGRSTFMVEMIETATILNQATDRSLVIFDEIGRGTATFDGLSIAWATLEYLHNQNKCRTIFSTHFHEMTTLSQSLDSLTNVTIKVKEWDGDLIFLHEITQGVADRSYGIQVAKLAGLPSLVLNRAHQILQELEPKKETHTSSFLGSNNSDTNFFVQDNSVTHLQKNPFKSSTEVSLPLINALKNLNPDDLSPRDALNKLYELKSLSEKNKFNYS